MIDAVVKERVVNALWPPAAAAGTSVWAILDCARDARIYPALKASQLDYRCLFAGRLHQNMQAAAPHLVEVSPAFGFTSKLIEMGWGRSWGVFLKTSDPSNLRTHLRTFLRVRDESGRMLFFRYYDPRVLRVYLPTCQRDELRTVFGPVTSYIMESTDGEGLIEFEFDGNRLHERRTTLTAH